ncbi:MAG: hypothetical protein J5666_05535, partial [Bacilli bacterium]|nr:hypothetical protein [Bacilli bacterium]
IINETLAHNEFEYSKKHIYRDHNKAHQLDALLYHCPKCHQDFTMHAKGNTLSCDCGFHLELDQHYQFSENEFGFKNIHDYYEYIKDVERKNIVGSSDVILSHQVKVKKLSLENKKFDQTGEGTFTLTHQGIRFEGTVNNEPVSFSHSLNVLQALAFSINEEYECYYNNELYYFYPITSPASCTKMALLYDLLVEQNNN